MDVHLFWRGLLLGFSIAAPVGPIGVLCLRCTLALTLTNPLTIPSFAAVFAGLGLVEGAGRYGPAGWLVLGVFCGSTA